MLQMDAHQLSQLSAILHTLLVSLKLDAYDDPERDLTLPDHSPILYTTHTRRIVLVLRTDSTVTAASQLDLSNIFDCMVFLLIRATHLTALIPSMQTTSKSPEM